MAVKYVSIFDIGGFRVNDFKSLPSVLNGSKQIESIVVDVEKKNVRLCFSDQSFYEYSGVIFEYYDEFVAPPP